MYTDEMEATDLFDIHEGEEEELDDFLATNPGNIFEEDTNAEMLYKMNEHLSHIIIPITEFVNNEEMMKHIISDHENLPQIVRSFENLPKAIEDEVKFVQTIDY